jgi:hypothetical protein
MRIVYVGDEEANKRRLLFCTATMNKLTKNKKPGLPAETVVLEGDWRDAMKKALQKKRPAEGWPKPERPDKKDKK